MSDTSAVVHEAYECFGRGDIPGLLDLLAADVDWFSPGSAAVPWVGRRRGRADVEQFFATLAALALGGERNLQMSEWNDRL